jgi:hypothetical protein
MSQDYARSHLVIHCRRPLDTILGFLMRDASSLNHSGCSRLLKSKVILNFWRCLNARWFWSATLLLMIKHCLIMTRESLEMILGLLCNCMLICTLHNLRGTYPSSMMTENWCSTLCDHVLRMLSLMLCFIRYDRSRGCLLVCCSRRVNFMVIVMMASWVPVLVIA